MRPPSTRSVAEVLARLVRADLSCVGASLRADGGVELLVRHVGRDERTGDAVRDAWPGAVASMQREHGADSARYVVEAQPGLWLTWSGTATNPEPAPPLSLPEPPSDRLSAWHVGVSDADGDADVVLASTPDEAAACFAAGWGLEPGTILAVSEEPLNEEDTLDSAPPQVFVVGDRGAIRAGMAMGARRP